jgi:DNA repair photolyase
MLAVESIEAKGVLTPTGGFLRSGNVGFTHSFSPAIGCALGKTACGAFCYAQFLQSHRIHGRGGWGDYLLVKANAAAALRAELERAARRPADHRHHLSRIRVFSASSTEPLVGPLLPIYRDCLRAIAELPVAAWVIQTRSPRVADLEEAIVPLGARVAVSMTLETDDDGIFAFGPAGSPRVDARMRAIEAMAAWPIHLHVAVSPALALRDPERFANWLGRFADTFTVDTAVDGDGTGEGRRTAATAFPNYLAARGIDWRDTRPARAFHALLMKRFGARAGWSCDGFRRLADPAALPGRERR